MKLRVTYIVVLFVALQIIAFSYYLNSSETNYVGGVRFSMWLREPLMGYYRLTTLNRDNRQLSDEVADLRAELLKSRNLNDKLQELYYVDSMLLRSIDNFSVRTLTANLVSQSILKGDNFFGVNKGSEDGVVEGMSVVSDGGVIGYITRVDSKSSVAQSILSQNLKIPIILKKNGALGSLWWDRVSPYELSFSEMTKYTDLEVGDTISVAQFSSNFVSGLDVGVVSSMHIEQDLYYVGKVRLIAEINQLGYVTLVENLNPIKIDENGN